MRQGVAADPGLDVFKTAEIQEAFHGSRREIVEMIRRVVEIQFSGQGTQHPDDGGRVGPAEKNETARFEDSIHLPQEGQRIVNVFYNVKKGDHIKGIARETDVLERFREEGVTIRGCPETRAVAPWAEQATEEDWAEEYLDKILSVKVVGDMDEAMDHIAKYGSAHTDVIVTDNYPKAQRFLAEVDSAAVMVNASSRLHDGFVFGLGAEIGISTDKLHDRGPMGLEELTTQKFIVLGKGHLRE